MKRLRSLFTSFVQKLPVLAVIAVALMIAYQNIDVSKHYAGWDNILAEFDLRGYAEQVTLGAWTEHQGLGAPAAQGQLSEVPRIPILVLLQVLLPDNLIRYVFIFLMFGIGGVGMYAYLTRVWLKNTPGLLKNWLAGLGGILYLLHVLTLQQFYISFEMFTVQFAYLPWLFVIIHRLVKKISTVHVLLFVLIQLLLAPSGHTPTVWYLAALFSVGYAFIVARQVSWQRAWRVATVVLGLTVLINAFWIIPNIYYTTQHAEYVQESRENQLFGPESLWSVREAGTISNLLAGTQYLFTWKDYSFANQRFEYIFNEWQSHLTQPAVFIILQAIGVMIFAGAFLVLLHGKKSGERSAIVVLFSLSIILIWIDLFPTNLLIEKLYASPSFLEAFRNPFTKLSILYSFACVVLFVQTVESITELLYRNRFWKVGKVIALLIITGLSSAIVYTALPSFQGHFLSERLQVKFPDHYSEMFAYLQTRPESERILPLPQLSHVGWEYYDWTFLGNDNGYQGMGFYFFGTSQSVLHRDSDRWVETSDFFYHELSHALDTKNITSLNNVLNKYRVDLVIVDDTRIEPTHPRSTENDHQVLKNLGWKIAWQKDFLTVYERPTPLPSVSGEVFIPEKTIKVHTNAQRVTNDRAYAQLGDYIETEVNEATVLFPFADLEQRFVEDMMIASDSTEVKRTLPRKKYVASLPALASDKFFTPAHIMFDGAKVTVNFPALSIMAGESVQQLPTLPTLTFNVNNESESVLVQLNEYSFVVQKNKPIFPIFALSTNTPLSTQYSAVPEQLTFTAQGDLDVSQLSFRKGPQVEVAWESFQKPRTWSVPAGESITAQYRFPVQELVLLQNPSENCSQPFQGSISTESEDETIRYRADRFGVNCNGFEAGGLSSAFPYFLKIEGGNNLGRGTKFFVNYDDPYPLPEGYLLHFPKFDKIISLPTKTSDVTSPFFLNWETRSFGKLSENTLQSIQLVPFNTHYLSQLKLQVEGSETTSGNNARISVRQHLPYVGYLMDVSCPTNETCYFGLDQSFDQGWVAIDLDSKQLLPHLRLNSWANGYSFSVNSRVLLVYLPEFVSLILMMGATTVLSCVLARVVLKITRKN